MFYFPTTKSTIFDLITLVPNLSENILARLSTIQYSDPTLSNSSSLNSLCHIILNNQSLREFFSDRTVVLNTLTEQGFETTIVPFLYTFSRDRQITTFSI